MSVCYQLEAKVARVLQNLKNNLYPLNHEDSVRPKPTGSIDPVTVISDVIQLCTYTDIPYWYSIHSNSIANTSSKLSLSGCTSINTIAIWTPRQSKGRSHILPVTIKKHNLLVYFSKWQSLIISFHKQGYKFSTPLWQVLLILYYITASNHKILTIPTYKHTFDIHFLTVPSPTWTPTFVQASADVLKMYWFVSTLSNNIYAWFSDCHI